MQFTSRGMTVEVKSSVCFSPDCACRNVSFQLVPAGSGARSRRIELDVHIDDEAETVPCQRSEVEAAIVSDFIAHGRAGLFSKIRDDWAEVKRRQKRIDEFVIDAGELERGTLVVYSSVIGESKSILEGGTSCSYVFTHRGKTFYAEDLYCPKPACKCEEVGLVVFGESPSVGPQAMAELFYANFTLKGKGKVTISDVAQPDYIDEKEAESIVRSLRAQDPGLLAEMRRRARVVNQIGVRNAARARVAAAAQVVGVATPTVVARPEARVGRNDPCPCRSGKKYKKCCGAG